MGIMTDTMVLYSPKWQRSTLKVWSHLCSIPTCHEPERKDQLLLCNLGGGKGNPGRLQSITDHIVLPVLQPKPGLCSLEHDMENI